MQTPIILASASPRRRELLAAAGISFTVEAADIDEVMTAVETAVDVACRLARSKAEHVSRRHPDRIILGADTIVSLAGQKFGKPRSMVEAVGFIEQLSGQSHEVITGVCLTRRQPAQTVVWFATTTVNFHRLAKAEITDYVKRRRPFDKAGAYAIQEDEALLVAGLSGGLRSNVIGLPVEEVVTRLSTFDVDIG